jgi:transposase
VKRGKTDAADAEAICEAVTRPTMRFVPIKTPEQQAALMMHRSHELLVGQRMALGACRRRAAARRAAAAGRRTGTWRGCSSTPAIARAAVAGG